MTGKDEYIYKSPARVIQLFKKKCICIYLRPRQVVFDNIFEFKQDVTLLLKDFDIKPILTIFLKTQYNAPLERVNQVLLNMLATKVLDKKVLNHIDPWCENLSSISWEIRDSYHRTRMATPGQAVFVGGIIFNLTSVVDWIVVTTAKKQQ